MSSKIEFAVQMTCTSCVKAVRESLDNIPGISNVDISLEKNTVVVDTTLTTNEVLRHLQSSGKQAVVKGHAGSLAAVAILDVSKHIQGVVRLAQINPETCIVDGTVDGLRPGEHGLFIHESGDLSKGCDSIGECYIPSYFKPSELNRLYGNLGTITADDHGRAEFRFEDKVIDLSNIIGRSLVITENPAGENVGKRLTCGIIARSSALFQNSKTICACDGVSIWDANNKPKSTL
ncbi:hypothetical protein PPYR_02457 [Photinus pyralis]|uniref:superoxide dismutase n=1 Tax=Photinus pyralis TaxID=7054 RepID=A0A1Y1JV25_PHOPY|nr:copper chaperone for superoxide dismutase [Photinus pyralis]KAB0805487.1 hypothetical protein PPYR_02457 [Photinus pyralis]